MFCNTFTPHCVQEQIQDAWGAWTTCTPNSRVAAPEDKVIERCTKDEHSLFGSRLRSNGDSNGEYESFVQSSITISIVQMLFLSRSAENRDRKHHPCDSREVGSARVAHV